MLTAAELAELRAWEERQARPEFARECRRTLTLYRERRLDCGHEIGRSEVYSYAVWKYRGERIGQRTACEPCAHRAAWARL